MELTITNHPEKASGTAVITLQGRVDALQSKGLREKLDALLQKGARYFVLDLSDVKFLDSAGLAVLVSLLKRAQQEKGIVKMVLPNSEAARRILHLTRFDKVFPIVESVESALASF